MDIASSLNDVLNVVMLIGAVVLSIVFTFVLSAIAVALAGRVWQWARLVDQSAPVLAFGQSQIGQFTHGFLVNKLQEVDEPTDKAVLKIYEAFKLNKLGFNRDVVLGLISEGLSEALEVGIELTDGKSNVSSVTVDAQVNDMNAFYSLKEKSGDVAKG